MAATNKVVKPVDDALKFIQQQFNTSGQGFSDIVGQLNMAAEYIKPFIDRNKQQRLGTKASPWELHMQKEGDSLIDTQNQLKSKLNKVTILVDPDKYNKFELLAGVVYENAGVSKVYHVQGDIVDDIYVARDWLKQYNQYRDRVKQFIKNSANQNAMLQQELLMLGQSILGRQLELTPYDTGFLRSQAILMVADGGNQVIIGYTAPYATYVHENLEIRHPYHKSNPDCGGQAKFLETALQEFFPDRQVWTEILGVSGVMAKISINPLYVEYRHYGQ